MRLLCIESPFKASERWTEQENVDFARRICRFAVLKGYAPYASHLFYTQEGILRDDKKEERRLGIEAGLAWSHHAEEVWFCLRPGDELSDGMKLAIQEHAYRGMPMRLLRFMQNGRFVVEEDIRPFVRRLMEDSPNPEGFWEWVSAKCVPNTSLLELILEVEIRGATVGLRPEYGRVV